MNFFMIRGKSVSLDGMSQRTLISAPQRLRSPTHHIKNTLSDMCAEWQCVMIYLFFFFWMCGMSVSRLLKKGFFFRFGILTLPRGERERERGTQMNITAKKSSLVLAPTTKADKKYIPQRQIETSSWLDETTRGH